MSNKSTPLTPEEMILEYAKERSYQPSGQAIEFFKHCMKEYNNQQTAALREELEVATKRAMDNHSAHNKAELYAAGLKTELEAERADAKSWKEKALSNEWHRIEPIQKELEAVKKERDEWKDSAYKANAEACSIAVKRDEAVQLLDDACEHLGHYAYVHPFIQAVELYKQRLSSGETKRAKQFGIMKPGEPGAGGFDPNNPPPDEYKPNPSEIPNSLNPEITDAEFEKCPICDNGDWTAIIDLLGEKTYKCGYCGAEQLPGSEFITV